PAHPRPQQRPAQPAAAVPASVPQTQVPVVASPPAPPPSGTIESAFVGKLRAYIRSITNYPTSTAARLLRPTGSVEVRFTLTRSGEVRDVDLAKPSGYAVLDKQALSIVRGGAYPPFPDDAWAGSAEHRFTVVIEFWPT
ncbi:MAG: energy transducer TonB, partial [Rhodopila sp.]|nr:energy transducer TonB [Rhodopila sp.]